MGGMGSGFGCVDDEGIWGSVMGIGAGKEASGMDSR